MIEISGKKFHVDTYGNITPLNEEAAAAHQGDGEDKDATSSAGPAADSKETQPGASGEPTTWVQMWTAADPATGAEGTTYFWNADTGETSWELPSAAHTVSADSREGMALIRAAESQAVESEAERGAAEQNADWSESDQGWQEHDYGEKGLAVSIVDTGAFAPTAVFNMATMAPGPGPDEPALSESSFSVASASSASGGGGRSGRGNERRRERKQEKPIINRESSDLWSPSPVEEQERKPKREARWQRRASALEESKTRALQKHRSKSAQPRRRRSHTEALAPYSGGADLSRLYQVDGAGATTGSGSESRGLGQSMQRYGTPTPARRKLNMSPGGDAAVAMAVGTGNVHNNSENPFRHASPSNQASPTNEALRGYDKKVGRAVKNIDSRGTASRGRSAAPARRRQLDL